MNPFGESFQTSINFRDELLEKRWPDEHRVAELIGVPRDADPSEHVARARVEGRCWVSGPSETAGSFTRCSSLISTASSVRKSPNCFQSYPTMMTAGDGGEHSGCIRRMPF
jgi:hypothetical protein